MSLKDPKSIEGFELNLIKFRFIIRSIQKFLELYSNDLQIVFFQNNLAVKKVKL